MTEPQRTFSMVNIAGKIEEERKAIATGKLRLRKRTIDLLRKRKTEKGDPLAAAEIAAILAAKKASELIPLCHPIPITEARAAGKVADDGVTVEAVVKSRGRTGVEMEALVAASTYLLTVWDMTKQYEKDRNGQYPSTVIEQIRIKRKVKKHVRG